MEIFENGTRVKVTNVNDTEYGDVRNVGRPAVVVALVFEDDGEHESLYELHFTDGLTHGEQFWMDAENKFKGNNSSHYHNELERI